MDGKILVLHGSGRSTYEFLESPENEDEDELIAALSDTEGVAWVYRGYGETSLVISLDGNSDEMFTETGNRLYDFAAKRGYRIREIITIG